jgi:malonyl-CoA/methylmalonyl-CoA synthetase
VQPELADRVAEPAAARSLRVIATDSCNDAPISALPQLSPDRRAMILYTSGSTGRPKGVVTTHANILAQVDSLVEAWQWRQSDRILNVLPMHHIHGIINVLSCAMRVGAVCEFAPFEAASVWERLARGDLTLFMAVPTIYAKLIAAWDAAPPEQRQTWSDGARKLRLMVSGSAALPVKTLERWEALTGQRLLERYGMTEIGMALSSPLAGERRPGHVGMPLPGVEVQRTDEAGHHVADDVPGEIEVRGPTVFQEYWGRPEATTASFRDGWFRTGDIAVVDDGAYRILGRSSVDIIKTGGYKVSALEIEDVLRTHPDIRDCAVVGVPDEEWGERIAVCLVCGEQTPPSLADLRTWAKDLLAPYKIPTLLRTCEDLPRNAMGKVQKPRVREMFEKGAST